MRNLWKYYLANTEGIIFVIDANRPDRIPDVKEELFAILQEESVKDKKPILIYANKQDLEGSVDSSSMIE